MKYFMTQDANGVQSFHQLGATAKTPDDVVWVDRLPDAFEIWDTKLQSFVTDDAAKEAHLKVDALREILAVSPLWRQLNDIRKMLDDAGFVNTNEASAARFAQIDQIRKGVA